MMAWVRRRCYQVTVGGTTHLVGGQLASTAAPQDNLLDTGSLVADSVHNESKYSAESVSASGGTGAMAGGGGGLSDQHHAASSVTESGIAAGTLIVHDGGIQGELNRNQTTLDADGVKNGFNAQKVAEDQQASTLAGYVGMRAAGDLEQDANLAPGSAGAVALHTVVGGAVAALGGGNVLQGALGAGAGEYATGVMSNELAKNGLDPNTSAAAKAILDATSLVAGAAAGGGAGAGISLAGEQYNQQLHPDYILHLESEAKTFAEQQCGCDLSELPADQQQELIDNATKTLLVTAQRMQDDAFNAKFDGAPLNAAAEAFIQNDNYGEWIGGTYYDLSQATPEQKADASDNAYPCARFEKCFGCVPKGSVTARSPSPLAARVRRCRTASGVAVKPAFYMSITASRMPADFRVPSAS